jgi:hypothetical protein
MKIAPPSASGVAIAERDERRDDRARDRRRGARTPRPTGSQALDVRKLSPN